MISPGREHDLKALERKIRETTGVRRERLKAKYRQIRAEGNDQSIVIARGRLIKATRANDLQEIGRVSEHLRNKRLRTDKIERTREFIERTENTYA